MTRKSRQASGAPGNPARPSAQRAAGERSAGGPGRRKADRTGTRQYEVLDPTSDAVVEAGQRAARLDSLDGKRIGLYQNGKLNARELMDQVELLLRQRHRVAGVVRGTYDAGRVMRADEWQDVERCDAILLTHGD